MAPSRPATTAPSARLLRTANNFEFPFGRRTPNSPPNGDHSQGRSAGSTEEASASVRVGKPEIQVPDTIIGWCASQAIVHAYDGRPPHRVANPPDCHCSAAPGIISSVRAGLCWCWDLASLGSPSTQEPGYIGFLPGIQLTTTYWRVIGVHICLRNRKNSDGKS